MEDLKAPWNSMTLLNQTLISKLIKLKNFRIFHKQYRLSIFTNPFLGFI